MGELIKIQREETRPMVICPRCKEKIMIDISPFKNDVSQILRDNCPKCRGELHVGIIILTHTTLRGILECIKIVIASLKPKNLLHQR